MAIGQLRENKSHRPNCRLFLRTACHWAKLSRRGLWNLKDRVGAIPAFYAVQTITQPRRDRMPGAAGALTQDLRNDGRFPGQEVGVDFRYKLFDSRPIPLGLGRGQPAAKPAWTGNHSRRRQPVWQPAGT